MNFFNNLFGKICRHQWVAYRWQNQTDGKDGKKVVLEYICPACGISVGFDPEE